MNLSLILLRQIIIMFILMGIGFWLYRSNKISLQGSKELGTLLLYVVLPCVIINSYLSEFSKEKVIGLAYSFLAAVLSLFVSIIVSHIVFGKKNKIEHFGTAFSNAGFIGIPLVQATLGNDAVFYVAGFVALLNILQWTYGVFVMTDSLESISPKKLYGNPITLSLLMGLILFFTQIPVYSVFKISLQSVANMTTPIAMIILGIYLGQMSLKDVFNEKYAYISCLLRLIVIPLLTIAVLSLLPSFYYDVKMSVLIVASASVGSNVAIFAQLHNQDYKRSVKSICLSTIFSIVTMPVIIAIGAYLW